MTKDYYRLLGVARTATIEEIRRAYFDAARRFHPDKNVAPGETELFLGVQEAYEVLSNPRKRARYDATLPPEEPRPPLLNANILFSRSALLSLDEPQLLYALLELTISAEVEQDFTPALNLCLVLDSSTSMQGGNIETVKATAIRIIRNLRPEDLFSIVTFSDRAETIIPPSRGVELRKHEARIYKLQPGGGTEISSGLEMAYRYVVQNIDQAQVNHIVLITDGRTYGDEEKCMAVAQLASERGIGISGLGIGAEWNDALLDELASRTGGSSAYVTNPQSVQDALLAKFRRLGRASTGEIRLEFAASPGVEMNYVFRIQPEAGPLSAISPMAMGAIFGRSNLKVLFEFLIRPEALQRQPVLLFEGEIKTTLAGVASETALPLRLTRPVVDQAGSDPPPAEIVDALSRLRLYRLQEQARLAATAGDYEQAAEQLARLATHLLARGERSLARTVLLEAENLHKKKSFSKQGGKEIKYGTRTLVMPGKDSDKR